jgi:hypothetical protein
LTLKEKNNTSFCVKVNARNSSRKITSFPLFLVFLFFLSLSLSLSCWLGKSCTSQNSGDPKISAETEHVEQKVSRRDALPLELALGQKRAKHKAWPHMSELVEAQAHMLLRTHTLKTTMRQSIFMRTGIDSEQSVDRNLHSSDWLCGSLSATKYLNLMTGKSSCAQA